MINLDEQHHCYINGVKQSRAKVNGNVVWRNCDVLESVSGQSRQSNLPDGYTELQYIQSSGSQYIDTLLVPVGTDDITIRRKFNSTSKTVTSSYFGCMPSASVANPRLSFGKYSSGAFASYNSTALTGTVDTEWHTERIYYADDTYYVQRDSDAAVSYNPQATSQPTLTAYIFARHGTDGVQVYDSDGTSISLIDWKDKDGNQKAYIVGAKRNSDGAIGMYDIYRGIFLANATSTAFTAGDEAVPSPSAPIEIKSCGDKTAQLLDIDNTEIYDGYINVITVGATLTFGTSQRTKTAMKALYVHSGETFTYSFNSTITGTAKWAITDDNLKVLQSSTNSVVIGKNSYTISATVDGWLYFTYTVSDWVMLNEGSTALDYEPYGYKVECVDNGVNLLNNSLTSNDGTAISSVRCTASIVDGKIVLTCTQDGDMYFGTVVSQGTTYDSSKGWLCPVKPNTTYTLSVKTDLVKRCFLTKYNASKVSLGYVNTASVTPYTFTTDADTYYVSIRFGYSTAVAGTDYAFNAQLEKGSTATDYVPCHSPKTWHCYLNSPLMRVGSVCDVLGKTSVVRNVVRETLQCLGNGTTSKCWSYVASTDVWYANKYFDDEANYNVIPLCTHYPTMVATATSGVTDGYVATSSTPSTPYRLYLKDTANATVAYETFKTWFDGLGAELYYLTSTPTTESIEWLDADGNSAIPKILDGESLVWTTSIQPSKYVLR